MSAAPQFGDAVYNEAPDRPVKIESYNQDAVNGIVEYYCRPIFHCDVYIIEHPTTQKSYPIIKVPGIRNIPICTKRGSGEGKSQIFKQNEYFIRRPGPKSETPQTPDDWDNLIKRCVLSAKEELLNAIRGIITGDIAQPATDKNNLESWSSYGLSRWEEKIKVLEESPAQFPFGRFLFSYEIKHPVPGFAPKKDIRKQHV